jgi:HlyD family secretion protein
MALSTLLSKEARMVKKSPISAYYLLFVVAILLTGCTPDVPNKAFGILERQRISLTSTSNEIIEELPIAEGQPVTKGQVLVVFSKEKKQAQMKQYLAQRDKAQAELNKRLNGERIEDIDVARANVANASVKLADSEKNYQRVLSMTQTKLAPLSTRDSAQADRDSARASLEASEQSLKKMIQGYRQEDIDAAKANLAAAKALVELQQLILDDLTVVATRDGILDSLPYNLGERVAENKVVAIIQSKSTPYARVYIPEPFRVNYPVGSPATVHIDGVANAIVGHVRWISVNPTFTPYSSMSEDDRSRFVYLAEIDLPESANMFPSGVPVYVDME